MLEYLVSGNGIESISGTKYILVDNKNEDRLIFVAEHYSVPEDRFIKEKIKCIWEFEDIDDIAFIKWENWKDEDIVWERKEEINLNKKQYEVLKPFVSYGFKYLVKDQLEDGLFVYMQKPLKRINFWFSKDNNSKFDYLCNRVPDCFKETLDFISWEDKEPCDIVKLVEEYEKDNDICG